jgi:WD40 repeat protein
MSKNPSKEQPVAKLASPAIYQLIYPPYCCASDGTGLLVTGGGGGSKSFGVGNMLQLHVVSEACSKLTTVSTLDMGEQITRSLQYSESHRLWTATMDDRVLIFDIDESGLFCFRPLASFSAELRTQGACKFAKLGTFKNQRVILTGGDESDARVWNFLVGQKPSLILTVNHGSGNDSDLVDGSWYVDGCRFVTGSRNGLAKVWDTASGTCLSSVYSPTPDVSLRACQFLDNGHLLNAYYAAPKGPSTLQRFDNLGIPLGSAVKLSSKSVISALTVQGERAGIAFNTGHAESWDLKTMRSLPLMRLAEHDLAVAGVALVPGGVISVSVDFTVRLWSDAKPSPLFWLILVFLAAAILSATLPLV